jgi:hypothetical protein
MQDHRVAAIALRAVDIGGERDAIAHGHAPVEVDPDLVCGPRGFGWHMVPSNCVLRKSC